MSLGGPNVTAGTIFEIGTVTKTFAAPGLSRDVSQVALWMLATHRATLPRWPPNPNNQLDPGGLLYTVEQLLDSLKGSPLTSTPPGPYLYSNYGFGILAFTDHIFTPLGMSDSVCVGSTNADQQASHPSPSRNQLHSELSANAPEERRHAGLFSVIVFDEVTQRVVVLINNTAPVPKIESLAQWIPPVAVRPRWCRKHDCQRGDRKSGGSGEARFWYFDFARRGGFRLHVVDDADLFGVRVDKNEVRQLTSHMFYIALDCSHGSKALLAS
ncbi:hypothetical protein M427DRAFT_35792 [Gonapodya prolifera JEL478]|uniref:Uncharacterized protein n=1 Tax=Gonapodya prolifera (strain JEL478) TaxID=1344416 RepID=A0A139A408_GONPJ|nr:hypothetical protein M427DRAFT_35792 [Gonapodya prolifera JEL478]|eukprot:KXS11409.1 hypothetical protein M427DRAFT_35792 [Gonapodya prolifera JEL478]